MREIRSSVEIRICRRASPEDYKHKLSEEDQSSLWSLVSSGDGKISSKIRGSNSVVTNPAHARQIARRASFEMKNKYSK